MGLEHPNIRARGLRGGAACVRRGSFTAPMALAPIAANALRLRLELVGVVLTWCGVGVRCGSLVRAYGAVPHCRQGSPAAL